jgi:hypothetical protein
MLRTQQVTSHHRLLSVKTAKISDRIRIFQALRSRTDRARNRALYFHLVRRRRNRGYESGEPKERRACVHLPPFAGRRVRKIS